jgi:hypothetical protein
MKKRRWSRWLAHYDRVFLSENLPRLERPFRRTLVRMSGPWYQYREAAIISFYTEFKCSKPFSIVIFPRRVRLFRKTLYSCRSGESKPGHLATCLVTILSVHCRYKKWKHERTAPMCDILCACSLLSSLNSKALKSVRTTEKRVNFAVSEASSACVHLHFREKLKHTVEVEKATWWESQ